MKKLLGYTLIELLIVIAIIGILTTILTTNLSAARARGRDNRRKQDLVQIQQALRLYYNDAQVFPLSLTWGSALTSTDGNNTLYLPVLPYDPSSTPTSPITYTYVSNGTTYSLSTTLENASDPDLAESQARCSGAEAATTYIVCEE